MDHLFENESIENSNKKNKEIKEILQNQDKF